MRGFAWEDAFHMVGGTRDPTIPDSLWSLPVGCVVPTSLVKWLDPVGGHVGTPSEKTNHSGSEIVATLNEVTEPIFNSPRVLGRIIFGEISLQWGSLIGRHRSKLK